MSLAGLHSLRPWTPKCGDPDCDGSCLVPDCIPPYVEYQIEQRKYAASSRALTWWIVRTLVFGGLGGYLVASLVIEMFTP